MKANVKYSFYFVMIGIFSYVFCIPYFKSLYEPLIAMGMLDVSGTSLNGIILSSGITYAIMTFFLSLIGVSLAKKVGLTWETIQAIFDRKPIPKLDKQTVLLSIGFSVIISFLLLGIQLLSAVLNPALVDSSNAIMSQIPWWTGMTSIFQGGVVEEVIFRLGIMTFLIWGLSNIFARKKVSIPAWIYVVSIILVAFAFGVAHISSTEMVAGGLTTSLVILTILGNSIGGVLFGYLYWKKGLEYAMIAHMVADFMIHFIFPLFDKLF